TIPEGDPNPSVTPSELILNRSGFPKVAFASLSNLGLTYGTALLFSPKLEAKPHWAFLRTTA
ncbi:MAG: hypothetical protein AAGH89_13630, partial [Verrucomicrobiota bacterium]